MPRRQNDTVETLADSDAVTTIACSAVIIIDDSWLEAVRSKLTCAKLLRRQAVSLLERLERLEREASPYAANWGVHSTLHRIVVGDSFDAMFNAFEMRAPAAMTAQNAVETVDIAARHLALEGHLAALRQLVFFISGNLEGIVVNE